VRVGASLDETEYHLAMARSLAAKCAVPPALAAAPLLAALESASGRLTGPRRSVAELIARRAGHFTAAELLADAERAGRRIGRATLFRSLELFSDLGLLERLDLPSGEHAYVACAPRHHHHVVCARCGRTAEVADLGLAEVMAKAGRRTGFRIDAHRLELYGTCRDCVAAAGGAA
jgi:Fur family ferric uptake transcriptional regulator